MRYCWAALDQGDLGLGDGQGDTAVPVRPPGSEVDDAHRFGRPDCRVDGVEHVVAGAESDGAHARVQEGRRVGGGFQALLDAATDKLLPRALISESAEREAFSVAGRASHPNRALEEIASRPRILKHGQGGRRL
jgi:hypothetical protein